MRPSPSCTPRSPARRCLSKEQSRGTGTLPRWFGTLGRLERSALDATRLSGPPPHPATPLLLSEREADRALGHSTPRAGTLPADLSSLTALQYFEIDETPVSGTLPPGLGALTRTRTFEASGPSNVPSKPSKPATTLHGRTPPSTLGQADTTRMSGTLPSELGRLKAMSNLHLDDNYALSGTLPDAFGLMGSELDELHLDGCSLSGTPLTRRFPPHTLCTAP